MEPAPNQIYEGGEPVLGSNPNPEPWQPEAVLNPPRFKIKYEPLKMDGKNGFWSRPANIVIFFAVVIMVFIIGKYYKWF